MTDIGSSLKKMHEREKQEAIARMAERVEKEKENILAETFKRFPKEKVISVDVLTSENLEGSRTGKHISFSMGRRFNIHRDPNHGHIRNFLDFIQRKKNEVRKFRYDAPRDKLPRRSSSL